MVELLILALLFLLSCATTPNFASNHEAKRNMLVLKMMHYDSVNSPFYDPKLTLEQRVQKMNQRSEARISHLAAVLNDLTKDAIEAQIYPLYGGQYLIPLKIGTPPLDQILIMDTGSSLLWVHCGFTIGGEGSPAPLYQNADSSSYVEDVSCDSPMCEYFTLRGTCGVSRRCEYDLAYVTGSTKGNLASEVVKFVSTDGVGTTIKHLVFGCSINSRGADRCSGILGLGQRSYSLVSQLNYTRFSYCLGNISEKESVSGTSFLTSTQIHSGGLVGYEGGMLIDSGATSTYLPEIAVNKLKEKIRSVIGTTLEEVNLGPGERELCYYGSVNHDLQRFPKITFHFAENANMQLTPENLFHHKKDRDDYFCLSVKDEAKIPFSILGVWAQQFFYISFDFNTMRLSFTRIDCDSLFD